MLSYFFRSTNNDDSQDNDESSVEPFEETDNQSGLNSLVKKLAKVQNSLSDANKVSQLRLITVCIEIGRIGPKIERREKTTKSRSRAI